jgi:hypothetical protein
MNFEEAIATHSEWKKEFRQYLAKRDGSLQPAEVALDHTCALGQWIYSEATMHSSLPEYTKLKFDHARFHVVAAELIQRANSGESIDGEIAPCSSSEFSTSSSAVVIAILAMKKRVSG